MNKNNLINLFSLAFLSALTLVTNTLNADEGDSASNVDYAIVVTQTVVDDPDWFKVVESLKERRAREYNVLVLVWDDHVVESLRNTIPRYACFIMKPEEATIEQIATVWKITREIDDDPYGDFIWGIITGYDANDALRLTKTKDMVVESAIAGTSIALKYFKTGAVYDELKKNHWIEKKEGQEPEDRNDAPDDTTSAIVDGLNSAQLLVTSGHASERNWSIGYAYKNGFFVAQKGELLAVPSNDKPFKINAKGSKIHLASGNCLLGHVDKPDCLALSMIRNANVDTLVGYVVPTWFGYMGWGIQDYYIEQPGRFTVAEAFFANNQALLNVIEENKNAPEDKKLNSQVLEGMKFDRDVVVLYGDPAWKNALAVQDSGWKQELTCVQSEDGASVWTLSITPLKEDKSYELIDMNGSERGGRPFFQFFPKNISNAKVVEGAEYKPVVTENFILVSSKQELPKDKPIVVKIKTSTTF